MSDRELVLARIRSALADVPGEESAADVPVPRDYLVSDLPAASAGLLAERLADYRAHVHHTSENGVPQVLDALLRARGARTVLVPEGVPARWLAGLSVRRLTDSASRSARELDLVDSVVTGCALAIAETGTLVLDAGPGQGTRRSTLVPDHHLCVVRVPEQVVASVPEALQRLDPVRPLTWISGPSATSDIELDRVEGVHGPRTLEVVLVHG